MARQRETLGSAVADAWLRRPTTAPPMRDRCSASHGLPQLQLDARAPRLASGIAKGMAPPRVSGRLVVRPVPDFASLHATWGLRLAASKAANRCRATVPQVRLAHWLGRGLLPEIVCMPVSLCCAGAVAAGLLGGTPAGSPLTSTARQAFHLHGHAQAHRAGNQPQSAASDETQRAPDAGRLGLDAKCRADPARAGQDAAAVAGHARVSATQRAPIVADTLASRLKAEATHRAFQQGRFETRDARWV